MPKSVSRPLGWPQVRRAGTAFEALKVGKNLRVDCQDCGRRYFDLAKAVETRRIKTLWTRDDIKGTFKCDLTKSGKKCPLSIVAFEVWFADVEELVAKGPPRGGAKPR